MKKIIALLLVALMLLTAACSAETPAETQGPALDFGIPTAAEEDISTFEYLDIVEIEGAYQCGFVNGFSMISALAPQFEIGGCTHPNENQGKYYRLDYANKAYYSQPNASLAANTSGITIRFCTNAPEILIRMDIYNAPEISGHMNARGVYGIDVYVGTGTARRYCGAGKQLMTDSQQILETVKLPGGYQEVLINLPLYAGAKNIEIGFPKGTGIAAPTQRSYGDIVIYGSSITQGAAASRPGLAYTNILGLTLNVDIHNLGFSGSALGEQVIAQYIASLEGISAFVMDYDHNNTLSGLTHTHYDFYRTVRQAHPDIPIILVSKPVYTAEVPEDTAARLQVIRDTYDRAVAAGDKNIYLVKGEDFFPDDYPDLYMVDTVHPNDLGMYYMAKTIYPVLKAALDAKE